MRATYNASSRVNKNKSVLSNRRRRSELMGTGKEVDTSVGRFGSLCDC